MVYLDNHLEKLLEAIFPLKSLFSNNQDEYRESLGVALSFIKLIMKYVSIMVRLFDILDVVYYFSYRYDQG